MQSGSVVFYKIATTCLLIFVGFIVRRMKLVPEISVSVFSKFTLNVALPCYVIYYMPTSISWDSLATYWFLPLLGMGLVAFSDLFGYVSARLLARDEVATFRILVGIPNWMFMAMAVCEPLFGEVGIRVVLFFNLGVTIYLWSVGMTSFRGGMGLEVVKKLLLNVQMLAAAIGIILALAFPSLKGMESLGAIELAAMPFFTGMATPVWETIYLLGSTALPLSIIIIGFYLGGSAGEYVIAAADTGVALEAVTDPEVVASASRRLSARSETRLRPGGDYHEVLRIILITVLRLLVVPALIVGVLSILTKLGLPLGRGEFVSSVIVLSMPSAVACISVTEVYGGNNRLAARVILWSTLASLATAPMVAQAAHYVIGWLGTGA